ncbi:MAG: hypothetical protein P4L33_04640 [Capsulimonadaceae bacterium]|nr:hypothetical protein [Capsulimonadaceae bacterium]
MHFVIRPILLSELPECKHCIRDRFLYDDDLVARLLKMWTYLLDRRMAIASCLDDLTESAGTRIVMFGMIVFLDPDFAARVRAGRYPYVAKHLLTCWEDGDLPLLTAKQIAQANASNGLHLLNLHYGLAPSLWSDTAKRHEPLPMGREVLRHCEEFFYHNASGFRLNEVLKEVYGPWDLAYSRGMHLVDRASLGPALDRAGIRPSTDHFPHLTGLDSAEASKMAGSLLGSLFLFEPPTCGFSPGEQELLLFALGGSTDQEIAEALSVSFAAIRKRWESIFEKVDSLPVQPTRSHGCNAPVSHSITKRRSLVQYLQYHREELRPWPSNASVCAGTH